MYFGWVLMVLAAVALIAAGLWSERLHSSTRRKKTPTPEQLLPASGLPDDTSEQRSSAKPPSGWRRLNFRFSFDKLLFLLALTLYLFTRLYALEQYPIYFFSDEAINTVLAEDFLRDGLRDYEGHLFPTFFKNYDKYNLSTSVYLQVLPALVFNREVAVTRGVAALTTLLAAVSAALILKHIFDSSAWWSAALFLSITPAWFLHSRTAFETALMTSFYAGFLYFYLRYRTGSLNYLFAAVLLGALAFYTYSPARVILPLTAAVFLLVDGRYHWQHRRIVLGGLGLAVLFSLPFTRFVITNPQANYLQLYSQASYWVQPGSLSSKVSQFAFEYLQGLNPLYWLAPGEQDLARHQFGSYGHILWLAVPFLVIGLFQAVRGFRQPSCRLLLISMLIIPCGAALIEVGITRLLTLVIPLAVLCGLGLAVVIGWLERKGIQYRIAATVCFTLLAAVNIWMLVVALRTGPTWHTEYGLGGMQWGARQVFAEINRRLHADPDLQIVLSPTWANGTDTLARFFLPQDPPPVELSSIDHFLSQKVSDLEHRLFVVPAYEYDRARDSEKLRDPLVEQILPYPNREPGFYFTRLAYVPQIEQIFTAEMEELSRPQTGEVQIDGQQVNVEYSRLDIGEIALAFDGDPLSLCRTLIANPAEIRLEFPEPRQISGLQLVTGSAQVDVMVSGLTSAEEFFQHEFTIRGSVEQPAGEFRFPQSVTAAELSITIRDTQQGTPGNVHFWEIILQ